MARYLVIDNFLDDPLDIRLRGLHLPFFDKHSHPYKESLGQFPGYRFPYIHTLDTELYQELVFKVCRSIDIFANREVDTSDCATHYAYQYTDRKMNRILPAFHYVEPEVGYRYAFGGIIYLNPNPPRNCGTALLIDGKKEVIHNKFNRFLLYCGSGVMHSVVRSFGRDKYNSRFVISTFTDVKRL